MTQTQKRPEGRGNDPRGTNNPRTSQIGERVPVDLTPEPLRSATTPHIERLALGSAAVVSPATAARWLPMSRSDARRWLDARSLVRDLAGRPVVVWGDVLDAIRSAQVDFRDDRPPMPANTPICFAGVL